MTNASEKDSSKAIATTLQVGLGTFVYIIYICISYLCIYVSVIFYSTSKIIKANIKQQSSIHTHTRH